MTFLLESARSSFELLLSIGAGSGLLYLLRWYWWRINAWSEIAAMAVSFVVAIGFFVAGKMGAVFPANTALLVTVFTTTFAWIGVTLATRPETDATLIAFYKLVRPAGPGWGSIPAKAGVGPSPDSISMQLLAWVLGCTFVYSTLFGVGSMLYGNVTQAAIFVIVWLISGLGLIRILVRFFSGAAV
jgi:SSS family solute:Na+ symporter